MKTLRILPELLILALTLCAPAPAEDFETDLTVFGCDGHSVSLPCSYAKFLADSGLERREDVTYPAPTVDQSTSGGKFNDHPDLYLPGADHYAMVWLKQDGASVYGDATVFRVGVSAEVGDDPIAAERCEFAGGVTLGMSEDEVDMRLGGAYKVDMKGDYLYKVYMDGDYVLTVCLKNDVVAVLEICYDHDFASRQ